MDEVEFKQAYNQAVSAADAIAAPETKRAVMLILQLIHALNERITEMMDQMEDSGE